MPDAGEVLRYRFAGRMAGEINRRANGGLGSMAATWPLAMEAAELAAERAGD